MFRRAPFVAPLLAAAALCLGPSAAQAKFVLITHGDTIAHQGEVPAQFRTPDLPSTAIGFKYSYFGVFWLDLWTWGGTYCLYKDKTYWELEPKAAALLLGKSESELQRPFLYTFPLGLLILVPLVVLGGAIQLFHKPPPNPAAELLKDERYVRALTIFSEQVSREDAPPAPVAASTAPEGAIQTDVPPPAPPPAPDFETLKQQKIAAAYEAAVTSLTQQGIERAEAEEKLSLLLAATQPAPEA
jgi:hypothetical protein